jgi:deoxyhypusine synthase
MERGLVDFIISTGANLYHDLHYALNFTLRRGSPFVDDRVLYERASSASTTCCSRPRCCSTPTASSASSSSSGLDGPVSTAEFHYASAGTC